ncbi:chemotaxis protein CheB [Candidatus Poribacteria bacterium]
MAKKKRTKSADKQGADDQEKREDPSTPDEAVSPDQEAPPEEKIPPHQKEEIEEEQKEEPSFPIVGIGASAGGLEAFEQFFTNMPSDDATTECGMAFVLVQHLDPTHESILGDLVKRYTSMKVSEVKDGMKVEPNCAYIIPPNRDMSILHGELHLMELVAPRGLRLPIDSFFRSLAQDRGEQGICIVLSGTGTDGTLGLRAVKGEGGMAMVQEPGSAGYDGMPRSAIATGLADYILPPNEMPEQLTKYVRYAFDRVTQEVVAPAAPKETDWLQKVFILLRAQTGHDFSYYKHNTILRRIERRMTVHQIEQTADYIRYLQENPVEVETLFKELLIGVTSFFRDPEAFAELEQKIIPALFEGRGPDQPLRVWVPGCSTGEEAYSIAMLIQEHMDKLGRDYQVQFFGTDIGPDAIDTARLGIYPDSIAVDVTPGRLRRFFTKQDNTYQIKRNIRDMLVFSLQNVIKDPPFSRMDLISCRNLLIYMGEELQKKLVPLFHYSLNQDSYLFLGTSEAISGFVDLFSVIDRKWKLFQRKGAVPGHRPVVDFPAPVLTLDADRAQAGRGDRKTGKTDLRALTERVLLDDYGPACVIINEKCEILYVYGRTGKYLEQATGEASLNILGMAREGLKLELTTAIRKVIAKKEDIRRGNLRVKTNGGFEMVDLIVKPVTNPSYPEGMMMVVFEDIPRSPETKPVEEAGEPAEEDHGRIAELERELRATREYLQTTIEELETSNEELKSTNEELQSSNEELQSTNEELETSKEELQSVNEELSTVNAELENKVDLLSRSNNDMNNLMASTEVGTIFLDNELCIQRFTPAATQTINLIQTDIGRPLSHIVSNLKYDNLVQDAQSVLDTLVSREMEIQDNDGLWYSTRIMPYRTTENVIEGVVVTFINIAEQKQLQAELVEQRDLAQVRTEYVESIVDTVREPLLVLDADLKVVSASRAFYSDFKVTPQDTEGQFIYQLGNGQWDIPKLRELLEDILSESSSFDDYRVEHEFETIGKKSMILNARQMNSKDEERDLILLAIEDVTGE